MQAPDSDIPIPKAKAATTKTQLTGPICATGGSRSVLVSGKNCPKISAYPIDPVAIATSTERNGVVFLSSMPSRKMQKKQKRPRSSNNPRLIPIRRETGAVELDVFEERINARRRSAAITPKEIAVRTFSLAVHAEAATPGSPGLLLCVGRVEITLLPRLFLKGY